MTPPTLTLVPEPDPDDNDKTSSTSAGGPAEPGPPVWGAPLAGGPDDLTPASRGAGGVVTEELWRPPVERRDVLPAWLRDRRSRRIAIRWWLGHLVHLAKFHGVRLPVYCGRIAWRSPVGAGRVAGSGLGRWVIDTRTRIEREALVDTVRTGTGAPQLVRIGERHRNTVLARSIVLAVTAWWWCRCCGSRLGPSGPAHLLRRAGPRSRGGSGGRRVSR